MMDMLCMLTQSLNAFDVVMTVVACATGSTSSPCSCRAVSAAVDSRQLGTGGVAVRAMQGSDGYRVVFALLCHSCGC